MHPPVIQQRSADEIAADRQLAQRLLLDLLIFTVLTIPLIVCEFIIEPSHRGFFCHDESISYPFRDNTVTPVMLGLLVGLLPFIVFMLLEMVYYYRSTSSRPKYPLFGWETPYWMLHCARHIACYAVGLVLTCVATEVGKYTIGRLRPHFMAVCLPRLPDGSTCADPQNQHRYIEDYVCVAEGYSALDVRQGRLSFPSGHSSLAFFGMVYLAIYTQQRMTWRGSQLARYALQFIWLMLAWYTALSRVVDNWHHWSDVLCGSLLGVLCALITVRYITRSFKVPVLMQRGASIPRQDTVTTLDEIMAAHTPPPYMMNGPHSFSNEQYCTKV